MFGSHLSIAGGLHQALLSAEGFGMTAVQVFTANPRSFGVQSVKVQNPTKNQQQWKYSVDEWCKHCRRLRFTQTVSHDSYLINLASPDEKLWRMSVELFAEELRRCVMLKIPYLVTHPGAHMGAGETEGLLRIVAALDVLHELVPTRSVITCLESTAGQGSSLGHRLEHLAFILERVKRPARLGVCLDTAHLLAAGYDFRGRKYARFRKELDSLIGIEKVKVWHLNDSKKDLGSRVDRHEHIGRGFVGLDGFRPIVRDKAFRQVPKILETPKGKHDDGRDWDAINLETLRGLMG